MRNGPFAVRFVGSHGEVPEELWSAGFGEAVESGWWYEVLERSGLEDQFTFLYAIIEERGAGRDGRPVGVAPLFVMDVPMELVVPPELMPLFRFVGRFVPSALYQRTLFVGSPCADEGMIGLLPGIDRRAALSCLQAALEGKSRALRAPMLVWKDFPAEWAADMAWLAERGGLFSMVSFPGTLAPLPGPTKDDYFAALKASRRHALKKKLRRSAENAPLVMEVIQHPDAAVLDEVFGLFWQTYEKGKTKFERLNRRFFELVAARPESHFIILREPDSRRAVAFMLCFAKGQAAINKFIGIDYARPKDWFLYFRLWEAALDWALAAGMRSIQSGQTGYQPKIEMGHQLIPLTNYCRHRNRLVQLVYRLVAGQIGWETLDADLALYLKAHPEAAI